MDFEFGSEIQELRGRLRSFLAEHWPEDRRAYCMNDLIARDLPSMERNTANCTPQQVREFFRSLGKAGFLGVGMPKEFGGKGGGHLARYVVQSELGYVGAPYPNIALTMVAPVINAAGSAEFKREHLTKIIAGEVEYCLGYTEPGAGTDLAALRTKAVRDGTDYVINGQKIFSSSAHYADYYFLAARTDPNASKHRGISMFLLPMDTPGLTITPLITMSGVRTNIVFIDNVRVPESALLGRENAGWSYLTEALAFERYSAMFSASLVRAYVGLAEWTSKSDGDPNSGASLTMARLRAQLRVADLLNMNAAWTAEDGRPPIVESAESKIAVTEARHRISRTALELMGAEGLADQFDAETIMGGQFDLMYRHSVIALFTAGANDIQRDQIANAGQGLPRSRPMKKGG